MIATYKMMQYNSRHKQIDIIILTNYLNLLLCNRLITNYSDLVIACKNIKAFSIKKKDILT